MVIGNHNPGAPQASAAVRGHKWLESLVQYLHEGVALLDSDRRLVLANPAARSYLPVLTEATVGTSITALGERPLEQFLAPRPGELPHELLVAGPPRRAFEIRGYPVTAGPEGRNWVLLIREVTAEHDMQQQMEHQGRLAAVGEMTAGIAHDFNNLLTGIIGYAELLYKDAALPASVRDKVAMIATMGQRASHLVRQILAFSRRFSIRPQPLDLLLLLKETITLLERTLPESIRVVLDSAPGDYLINADMVQIQQVLINLSVNARDAMLNGGELHFRLSRLTLSPGMPRPLSTMPAGTWVVLAVSDTGTGIPPQVLGRIFEPFFTTKADGQGTGLGLAQVHNIVTQYHGQIMVRSRAGQGTTFTLYLPALTAPVAVAGDAASEEEVAASEEVYRFLAQGVVDWLQKPPELSVPARAVCQPPPFAPRAAFVGPRTFQRF